MRHPKLLVALFAIFLSVADAAGKDQKIVHALNRLTFGPRPGDLETVRKIGLKKWIDQQLHPERIAENPVLAVKLKPLESLSMTQEDAALHYFRQDFAPGRRSRDEQQLFNFVPEETRRKIMLLNAPQAVLNYDLAQGKIYRAVYSNRQLAELLADFWFNHFNVCLDKGADRYLVPTYERDAIRPNVLSRFRDLLGATARSPAMLFYLDNWQSVAPRPHSARGLNENYARELMELHTLGVDGGYTQKDIIEVARCFTGWTIKAPRRGGGFEFKEKVHDKSEKVVLGVKIPAGGGIEDGERVLDILAAHPSTARFVSHKLASRFVSDLPPEKLVDRMAETFKRTGGDLRAVVKSMLESREFWSEGAYRAKVKTPLEMVVSAVRAVSGDVEFAFPLANRVAQLGEPLYRKVEPTGYPSANAEWVSSTALIGRMNFSVALAQNRIPGVKVPAVSLFQTAPASTRAAVEQAVARESKRSPEAVLNGLVLGSPDFQRR